MATQSKRDKKKAAAPDSPAAEAEESLKLFQEAGQRFAEATSAAQQAAFEQWGKTYFEVQEEARLLEQEAMSAISKQSQDFFGAVKQEPSDKAGEDFAARARQQLEYEAEIRKVYVDAQEKLSALAQKLCGDQAEDISRQWSDQRQQAYQAYLGDLQKAWSSTTASDPQTMSAVALSILSTLNACAP